jgi:hypothetical protein
LTGTAGLVDWYGNGVISKWLINKKVSLESGELTLIHPGPVLNCRQIVVVGVDNSTTDFGPTLKKLNSALQDLQEPPSWIIINESCPKAFVQEMQKNRNHYSALKKTAVTVEVAGETIHP